MIIPIDFAFSPRLIIVSQNLHFWVSCNNIVMKYLSSTASWSSGNAFVSGAGVWGSNLGPVKSNTVMPTARHRCGISLKGAVLLGSNDEEMSSANSLDTSA